MSASEITVATVNWYSVPFIRDLFSNILSTADVSDVSFLICDNTNGYDQRIGQLSFPNLRIIQNDPGPNRMSMAHGLALNLLLSQVHTEYCLFIDPDCLVLQTGWDTICKQEIQGSVVAVGAPYPPWKLGKGHSFPGPHFHFFKTSVYQKLDVDWTPYSSSMLRTIYDQGARAVLKVASSIGYYKKGRSFSQIELFKRIETMLGVVSKDVGWKIPKRLQAHSYTVKLFTVALRGTEIHSASLDKSHLYHDLAETFELNL